MAKFNLNQILNDASRAAAKGGEPTPRPAESRMEKISVYDLVPSEDNFYSIREIEELKAAIEIAGKVLQNLVVVPLDGGKYKVIAGHRRRLASISLVEEGKPQYEFVPCDVEPNEEAAEDQEVRDGLMLIVTNSQREKTAWDKIEEVRYLREVLEKRMARDRSPERDKARQIWLDSGGTMTAREVAEKVGAKPEQVRKWKSLDNWNAALEAQKPPRKRGGQPGNKNAAGAGAPMGNKNAETHGAYSAVRIADLPPEQREYIEGITLETEANMLTELRLLIAKEADLQNKIAALEGADPDTLYIDRVVEMRTPKGQERLKQQMEKLEALQREEDSLLWDMDTEGGKPPTRQQEKKLERLQREIAALQDTTGDKARELEESAYNVTMQTVIKASAFDRAMKLEAELNKIHGRIIKLLDSIKGYELESRRVRLEERKYNLAKQKLSGAFEIDPATGEIDDETEGDGDVFAD